jgi:hypothetical protein
MQQQKFSNIEYCKQEQALALLGTTFLVVICGIDDALTCIRARPMGCAVPFAILVIFHNFKVSRMRMN